MHKVISLFPTPFMIVNAVLNEDQTARLKRQALDSRKDANARTDLLSHTQMVEPGENPVFRETVEAVLPEVARFGALMFGDDLDWTIKEMWLNVLEHGGSQYMHSHANSFASGIIYLTNPDPSSRTMFQRHAGAGEFVFKHDAAEGRINEFTADRWVVPEVQPGDLVLYPSHLLHGVPPNRGEQRITLALNAIPDRLKSFGYEIRFSP